jgi:glycosyltransferase involved in cell wall biosynthesis
MNSLPTIGIVVPNYNGAAFIEACLQSIRDQDYPNLQVFIADAGSKDASMDIVAQFAADGWSHRSHSDDGQASAIQEGFAHFDTDLVGWLNSDDTLLPGALRSIAEAAQRNPNAVLFHGNVDRIDVAGTIIGKTRSLDITYERMRSGRCKTVQPGSFYRRWATEAIGGVSPEFYLLMDVDLWIRLSRLGKTVRLDRTLAEFRVHDGAKSSENPARYYQETLRLAWRYERDRLPQAAVRRSVQIARHAARAVFGR